MSCLLESFRNPNLSSALPGLRLQEQAFAVVRPLFTCCNAEGMRFCETRNSFRSCSLAQRLRTLHALLGQFKQVWGSDFPNEQLKPNAHYRQYAEWLAQHDKGLAKKGRAFSSQGKDQAPSYALWLMAFSTVWRTGFDVHVISLGRTKVDKLLPPRQFAAETPGVVFIEQKEHLWKPQAAFDLAAVINWCEGAMLPVWIDFLQLAKSEENTSQKSLRLETAISRKLTRAKERPALEWMGPDSRSRLHSVCSESEKFL